MNEMPHIDMDQPVGSLHGTIDLRVERYPLSDGEKADLSRALNIKDGVVAEDDDGTWLLIGKDGVRLASPQEVQKFKDRGEVLPSYWKDFLVMAESKEFTDPMDKVNPALPDPEKTGREFMKTSSVFAVRMDMPFDVKTLEGPVSGKAGDFLCKGEEDELWPVDGEIFLKTYKPIEAKLEKVFKKS